MCVVQVMECNWDGLLKKVREAQDLDQIISAHDTFLDQITSQCLLDADGQVFVQKAAIAIDHAPRCILCICTACKGSMWFILDCM